MTHDNQRSSELFGYTDTLPGHRTQYRIRTPWGMDYAQVQDGEEDEFVRAPCAYYAKLHGATRQQYLEWLETGGTPRCRATTKAGKPCRNFVKGGTQWEFADWLEADRDGRCQVHE